MELRSIGIIPDGNRRYARKAGLSLAQAYGRGARKAEEVLNWTLDEGRIRCSTFYALSTENFLNRSALEKAVLFRLLDRYFRKVPTDRRVREHGIRLKVIGRTELLPAKLRATIRKAEEFTDKYDNYQLNLAICYGGRQELVDAVNKLAAHYAREQQPLTEADVEGALYANYPAPDLVIRTGGVQRLSGFLTWETAYSELYFSDKLWPEFSKPDFNTAIEFYDSTERRFGR